MKELSVFIDESGDFGDVKERPAYYLVTLKMESCQAELKINCQKNNRKFNVFEIYGQRNFQNAANFSKTTK